MCGRYVVARANGDLLAAFAVEQAYVDEFEPSYNVPPTATVPLILDRCSGEGAPVARKLVTARLGLVPSWGMAGSVSALGPPRQVAPDRNDLYDRGVGCPRTHP
ncbi:SOS response-associated peptidase family protein [Arthrobacter sp. KN11-1C]|uniref:SOS response-associated peptidase family protein n=1 Tax=Arthrobacter sp. KN11-1C TaxID=3445774 RepID=UPI003FA022DA